MPKKAAKQSTGKQETKALDSLTPQQERFAQLIAAGMNQSAAYRAAYNAKRMKAETVNTEASKLAKHPQITPRVQELRKPVIEEVRYDLKQAMHEAEQAMTVGLLTGQAGAVVSAVHLRAKLNGLMVEDRKNDRPPFEGLSDDELDRATAETERAIARAQGQAPVAEKGTTKAARAQQA